jgi:hypothetical protein
MHVDQERLIDFIIRGKNKSIHALQCRINPDYFNVNSLKVFREIYPLGRNVVIYPFVSESFVQKIDGNTVLFCSIENIEGSIRDY